MNPAEHPASQFFDAIGPGRTPTAADVDALVEQIAGDDLSRNADHWTPPKVREHVVRTTRRMVDLHAAGHAGRARELAREARRELLDNLPDYQPPAEHSGLTLRERIERIPR